MRGLVAVQSYGCFGLRRLQPCSKWKASSEGISSTWLSWNEKQAYEEGSWELFVLLFETQTCPLSCDAAAGMMLLHLCFYIHSLLPIRNVLLRLVSLQTSFQPGPKGSVLVSPLASRWPVPVLSSFGLQIAGVSQARHPRGAALLSARARGQDGQDFRSRLERGVYSHVEKGRRLFQALEFSTLVSQGRSGVVGSLGDLPRCSPWTRLESMLVRRHDWCVPGFLSPPHTPLCRAQTRWSLT